MTARDLPELPEAVTTIGPCMFGGEPSVETKLYTAAQMLAFREEGIRAQAASREGGTVNMNDRVGVKLTERGLAIHKAQGDELRAAAPAFAAKHPYREPKTDAEGYHWTSLWSLFEDYGPHISLGCIMPFETAIRLPAAPTPEAP